jgi:trypsin-like peptidase
VSQRSFLIILAAIAVTIPAPADAETSSGSGIAIGTGGEVLTNSHVIEGCANITAQLADKIEAATVLARDDRNDLAVIRTKSVIGTAAIFREGASVRPGDTVVAMGYPLSGLLATTANVSVGTVSALAGLNDDSRYLQISAPVQPGNSGGPLLDTSGHLVGIVTAKLNAVRVARFTGDVPQNVNFAIKADIAKTFLDSRNIKYQSARSDQQMPPADIADIGRPFTVYLECSRVAPASASRSEASSRQPPPRQRQASLPPPSDDPGTFATIGGVFVRLPAPSGFCELDESNASDNRLITVLGDLLQKSGNKLLAMSADCYQLEDWHTGKRQLLDDYAQYQTPIASMNKPPSETVAQSCNTLRARGNRILANQLPDIKARVESTLSNIKMNETSFIGVLGEDNDACYAGLLQKIHTEADTDKTQITVFAISIVKKKFVFSYRFSVYRNPQTVDATLHKIKIDVAALIAANR